MSSFFSRIFLYFHIFQEKKSKYWNAKRSKYFFRSVKLVKFGNVSCFFLFFLFFLGKEGGKSGKKMFDKNAPYKKEPCYNKGSAFEPNHFLLGECLTKGSDVQFIWKIVKRGYTLAYFSHTGGEGVYSCHVPGMAVVV